MRFKSKFLLFLDVFRS